jgi:rhamnosyltransferase
MARIAGVVIVYFPDFNKLIFNIDTYVDNVEKLLIVFNSPVSIDEVNRLQTRYSNIQMIFNQENNGIAKALNQTALKVMNQGYEWLLTMDQDSYFLTSQFFEEFEKINKGNVAIFCPNPVSTFAISNENNSDTEEILCAITSGNLLNLEAWKTLNGFEEKLFIDEVDNDFCLKAVLRGFKIIRFKNIQLIHELGRIKRASYLIKKYTIITHPPIRAYYIIRNNLYIFNKYKRTFPEFVKARKIMLLKGLVKIILFSDKRIQNCYFIFYGIRDYLINSYGCFKGEEFYSKQNQAG